MINEDKIREVWASNPERGFKLLIDFFQQPIYWHIRRLVVSHEDAEDILKIYAETKENPLHFPGEKFLEVKRNTSHRRWIKKHPQAVQD